MRLRNCTINFYSLETDLNSNNDMWPAATSLGSIALESSVILEKIYIFFSVALVAKKGEGESEQLAAMVFCTSRFTF